MSHAVLTHSIQVCHSLTKTLPKTKASYQTWWLAKSKHHRLFTDFKVILIISLTWCEIPDFSLTLKKSVQFPWLWQLCHSLFGPNIFMAFNPMQLHELWRHVWWPFMCWNLLICLFSGISYSVSGLIRSYILCWETDDSHFGKANSFVNLLI